MPNWWEGTSVAYGTPEWENHVKAVQESLKGDLGQTWTTSQLESEFEVHAYVGGFMCTATKRSTRERGSLMFGRWGGIRLYYGWKPR